MPNFFYDLFISQNLIRINWKSISWGFDKRKGKTTVHIVDYLLYNGTVVHHVHKILRISEGYHATVPETMVFKPNFNIP